MADKTQDKTQNAQPASKPLTAAQASELAKNLEELNIAQARVKLATEIAEQALDLALDKANSFLAYCANEHGVTIGQDGWIFHQDTLSFVQMPNGNGAGEGA